MTMHKKMARGAFWSLIEKGGQQGLSFVLFMFLARLLGPSEYGLASICFIYFALTSMVVSGLVDGIVSLQVEDDLRLSSMFWAAIAVGAGISLLCAGTAQPLAAFMGQPRLESLLYWFSLIPLLVGGAAVPNLLILKEMDFKLYALRTLIATILGGVCGIAMAYEGYGAFSIIGQQVTFYLISNLVVWNSISWRPRFCFNFAAFREVVKPGLAVTGNNVVNFVNGQAPQFIIGKIAGPTSLGFYAFTMRMQYALSETLIAPTLAVIYPAFAKLKDDTQQQKLIIEKIFSVAGFALFPILSLAAATAPVYVPLFFGKAWDQAVPLLQIYIITVAYMPFFMTVSQVFRAHGRMTVFIRLQTAVIVAKLCMLLFLRIPNGLIYMGLGIMSVALISVPTGLYFLDKWIGIDVWQAAKKMWAPVLCAGIAFAVTTMTSGQFAPEDNQWLRLIAALLAGGLSYLLASLYLQRDVIKNLRTLYKKPSAAPIL